jgi:membrane protein DedA with SNARE-associated domain
MNALLELADPWAYVVVFLLALAEGAALIGLFLPGETAMILGGVLVSQGRAGLGGMLLAGCLGSALGDSVGYWVGHRFGGALRRSRLGRRVGEERWRRADAFLAEKGAKAVFFGRFLGFLRTLVPPLAGSSGMGYRRFVVFNAPAAVLWAGLFVLLGLAAGRSWRVVSEWAGRASALLLVLLGVGIGLFMGARWVRSRFETLRGEWQHAVDHPRLEPIRRRLAGPLRFIRGRFDASDRYGLSLTLAVIVAISSTVMFGAVVESLVDGGDAARLDATAARFFLEHQSPRLDVPMDVVAAAGRPIWSATFILLFMVGMVLVSKRWTWLLLGAALVVGGLVLDDAVGHLLEMLLGTSGPVLPSPEMTAGAAAVGGIAFGLARLQAWSAAVVVTALLLFLVTAIAVALMYFERATLSAIATGFFLGSVWSALADVSFSQLSPEERPELHPAGASLHRK